MEAVEMCSDLALHIFLLCPYLSLVKVGVIESLNPVVSFQVKSILYLFDREVLLRQ